MLLMNDVDICRFKIIYSIRLMYDMLNLII